ncbi:MAG: helix-turn-helix transcriptional regulator [Lewinellaceae bacterium]|nr:helix-turn-helix transcriptional regulator [Lewinellaceae bacterium]
MTIGQKIRDLRESAGMLQRELAGHLQVGDSYISKVESDQKVLKKEHLKTVSDLFDCPYSELLTLWLADKVYDLVKNENPAQAIEVLKVAEQEIKYGKRI